VRSLFFLLLLANLALLAWAEWIDVPQPAAANDAYAKLPRLKLVGETSGDAKQSPSPSGSARKTALQRAAQPPQCLSFGPFYDEAGAARGTSLLHDKGLTPHQRSEQGEIPKGFWVYIGDLKTDRDVAQVLRLLEQSHVDDAHLMPDTDASDSHRVSVGLFSDRDRADRRAQSLQKLGLQPEVAERKVPAKVFYVDADIPSGTTAPGAQDFAGTADSQATVRPCPGAATSQRATPQPASSEPAAIPLPRAPGAPAPRTKMAGAGRVE
jgi:hypothetical protein